MKVMAFVLGGVAIAASACHYPGAIYTEYTHLGLGVRSSPESASPVDVNFGYERGVLAIVPKRADGKDATSLISRTDIGTNLNQTGKTLLQVSSDFIAGTAAIAATIPAGADVEFIENGVVKATAEVKGDNRIVTALRLTAVAPTPEIRLLKDTFEAALKHPRKGEVFTAAAALAPAEFKTLYDQKIGLGLNPQQAFNAAKNDYTSGSSGEGPKLMVLSAALTGAMAQIDGGGN